MQCDTFPEARLLIFAKAPIVGQVKTRLIPAMGAVAACEFYRARLQATLDLCCQAAIAPVVVWTWPDADHPTIRSVTAAYPVAVRTQQGQELGARMAHAVTESVDEGASLMVLIGVDAPALSAHDIAQAFDHLQQGADVVMSPAEDGGYVLLGLRTVQPALFVDMPWSTDQVATITRERCRQLGLRLVELPERWDIDRPEDVYRFYEGVTQTV